MKKMFLLSALCAFSAVIFTGCVAQSVPRLTLKVNPATHEVTLSNPKDTTIKNFSAIVSLAGVSSVSFDSLTTVMNPDVITTTGEAQAKLISATGDAVSKAMASVPK
jgi:hypothetical protein